jgi:hypothetical protein
MATSAAGVSSALFQQSNVLLRSEQKDVTVKSRIEKHICTEVEPRPDTPEG